MSLSEKAKTFAISAHNSINQKRKYTNEPYHVHCGRVVEILKQITDDQETLAAAWMHDVLEDVAPHNSDYSEEKIRELFGERVCNLVLELTDTKLEYGNRAARKAKDRERLHAASIATKNIKLADLIDNFIDITKNDPNFSIVIARETEMMLPSLVDGDHSLFSRLTKLLADYRKK